MRSKSGGGHPNWHRKVDIRRHPAHSQVNSGMKKTKGPGLLLVGVGSMMTSMIAAGFILGYFTDSWLNTQPIFLISFGALGFIGAFLKVYRLLSDPELN